MQRIKMAGGMLVGAVVLHVGFMACSAQSPTGMIGNLLDAGSRDTGILGGRDARAQEMPCTQWEVKINAMVATATPTPVEAGWEPFAVVVTSDRQVILRRCTSR